MWKARQKLIQHTKIRGKIHIQIHIPHMVSFPVVIFAYQPSEKLLEITRFSFNRSVNDHGSSNLFQQLFTRICR